MQTSLSNLNRFCRFILANIELYFEFVALSLCKANFLNEAVIQIKVAATYHYVPILSSNLDLGSTRKSNGPVGHRDSDEIMCVSAKNMPQTSYDK